MYYFVLACLWGSYCAYMQSQKDIHNDFSWIIGVFVLNTVFMPISILVWAYRKFVLKAEDLQ